MLTFVDLNEANVSRNSIGFQKLKEVWASLEPGIIIVHFYQSMKQFWDSQKIRKRGRHLTWNLVTQLVDDIL